MSKTNEDSKNVADENKKILVVDDDQEILTGVRIALESRGYRVVVAHDGNEALTKAESERPDLIILDMMMPKRSGFLVMEKLQRSATTPPPMIMITANEGKRHEQYAELLGAVAYIRKPFAMERLLDSVEAALAD